VTTTVTTSVTTPAVTSQIRMAAGQAVCPVCGTTFTLVRRQAYCTHACRQAAWRAPQPGTSDGAVASVAVPAGRSRRDVTVYACTDCEQRYLGLQWCPDCQRPCTRVGLGGHRPDCGEPLTVDELLNTGDDQHLPGTIR